MDAQPHMTDAKEDKPLRGCPKTRISAGRDDLNAKEKRVIIGDKREE